MQSLKNLVIPKPPRKLLRFPSAPKASEHTDHEDTPPGQVTEDESDEEETEDAGEACATGDIALHGEEQEDEEPAEQAEEAKACEEFEASAVATDVESARSAEEEEEEPMLVMSSQDEPAEDGPEIPEVPEVSHTSDEPADTEMLAKANVLTTPPPPVLVNIAELTMALAAMQSSSREVALSRLQLRSAARKRAEQANKQTKDAAPEDPDAAEEHVQEAGKTPAALKAWTFLGGWGALVDGFGCFFGRRQRMLGSQHGSGGGEAEQSKRTRKSTKTRAVIEDKKNEKEAKVQTCPQTRSCCSGLFEQVS